MFYWTVLLFIGALASGVFALMGYETAQVFLLLFTGLCIYTAWRARHSRDPDKLGPDS